MEVADMESWFSPGFPVLWREDKRGVMEVGV